MLAELALPQNRSAVETTIKTHKSTGCEDCVQIIFFVFPIEAQHNVVFKLFFLFPIGVYHHVFCF